jgi:hypothetical protein
VKCGTEHLTRDAPSSVGERRWDTVAGVRNRVFYGLTTPNGNVVVIDSPSLVSESLVPIDAPQDVLVNAACAAVAPSVGLLNRGLRGFIAVDAGIGRNEAGMAARTAAGLLLQAAVA